MPWPLDADRFVGGSTAHVMSAAAARCDCPSEPTHPATIGILCPDGCSGHGRCDRECVCDKGWGGFGCWTQLNADEKAGGLTLVSAPSRKRGCADGVLLGRTQWAANYKLVVVLEKDDSEGRAVFAGARYAVLL